MTDLSEAVTLKAALSRVDLGAKRAACPQHGEYESKGFRLAGLRRDIWSACPACEREAQVEREAEERRRAADRISKERERAIGRACIPLRFQDRTLATFKAESSQQLHAVTAVRGFVEEFERHAASGAGLVLSGPPGTGKTHLGAAALMELLGAGHWVQYATCMDLIRMVRETWRKDSERSEREVLSLLGERIDLLVIDEIGVQFGSESEQLTLFEILDRRYSAMRPSILITNQNRKGFGEFVGDRVYDRLTQTHTWVPFDWASYRRTAREAQ